MDMPPALTLSLARFGMAALGVTAPGLAARAAEGDEGVTADVDALAGLLSP